MLIGYARVSTQDQNTALQEDALRKAECELIYVEKASGAREDRPKLAEMLKHARRGDTIAVWRIDRLARSIKHLIEIAADLNARGIHLKSLCDPIDTSSPGGEMVFHILAALAQFERRLIQARVRAGLEAAWAAGSVSGRKPLDHAENLEKLELARTLVRGGKSVTQAAKAAGIGRSTLYRYLEAVPQTPVACKKRHRHNGTDLETVSQAQEAAATGL